MIMTKSGSLLVGLAVMTAASPVVGRDLHGADFESSWGHISTIAGSHRDTIIDPILNWPLAYGVQQTGEISASFTSYGQFGLRFNGFPVIEEWPVANFVTPADSSTEYLFAGAIWIGGVVGSDTLVSVGADGWQHTYEMYPPGFSGDRGFGSVSRFDYPADFSMRSEFNDTITEGVGNDWSGRPHIPMDLRIANRSHVWRSETLQGTIMYDMVITNVGDGIIGDGFVGFYFDCDVLWTGSSSGAQDDLTGSLRQEGVAYAIDNDGELTAAPPSHSVSKVLAFRLLHTSFDAPDTNYNWWVSNANPELDFGPRMRGTPQDPFRDFGTGGLGTPEGDANKHYMLSHREWDYDQFRVGTIDSTDSIWLPPPEYAVSWAMGVDTRFLMSIGPFDLPPDSSVRVLYATFTGDSTHTISDNLNNLPEDPDTYFANLDFTDMLANAAVSGDLADSLLNPELSVTGLNMQYQDWDSAVIEWDPWVFDDVEGYEIYLSEIPPDSLPYPGLPAPWLKPPSLLLDASVDRTYRHAFLALDPHKMYFVNVANRTARSVGDEGDPIFIEPAERLPAPEFAIEYTFVLPGNPVVLDWEEPPGVDVDHYKIHRFAPEDSLAPRYLPFYDEGYNKSFIDPVDSFFRDETWYYYYAMEVYVQVDSQFTNYIDTDVLEGNSYIVSAVDKYGFESELSIEVTVLEVEPRTRDILFINKLHPAAQFTREDSLLSFYNTLLAAYDYDIHYLYDSIVAGGCLPEQAGCVDFNDLMPFRLVIIDDDVVENVMLAQDEIINRVLTKYLLSGGKVMYFGGLGMFGNQFINSEPEWHAADEEFVERFFGIDSIFYVGPGWGVMSGEPVDSLYGLQEVFTVVTELAGLVYDSINYRFTPFMEQLWPRNSAPSASAFKVNDNGQITHLFHGAFEQTCLLENEAIGVKTITDEATTYLFGCHLWYMGVRDARLLLGAIVPTDCCIGLRGNVDDDLDDKVNIVDVVELVSYLFGGGPTPACRLEADVNGDGSPDPLINIVDLTYLVDYLFSGGPAPVECPAEQRMRF